MRVSRPSMRGSPFRICERTIFASISNSTLPTRRPCRRRPCRLRRLLLRASRTSLRRFLQLRRAGLLVTRLIRGKQFALRDFGDARNQHFVLRRRLPVPFRLAAFTDEFVNRVDRRLHLLVAEHDRAQHHVFRQLIGFRFDHQHRAFRTGDDEVQTRLLDLRARRVQHVFVVDVRDARGSDGTVERQAGHGECRRRADQRGNVGRHVRVDRHHVDDDLHFVIEALGKQRAQRTVDQPRDQRFAFRRTAFAAEKTARNLAGE